jgi:hypothetical protein
MQCETCQQKAIDETKKPFGDYFLCSCYGKRKLTGFGPELHHWADKMCEYCADEKKCCRTCGVLIEDDSLSSSSRSSSPTIQTTED